MKPIEQRWKKLEADFLAAHESPMAIEEMRLAFYAGAMACFGLVLESIQDTTQDGFEKARYFNEIRVELMNVSAKA